ANVVVVEVADLTAPCIVGLDPQTFFRAVEAVVIHVHVAYARIRLRAYRNAVTPVDVIVGDHDAPLAVRANIAVPVDSRHDGTGRARVVGTLQDDVVISGAHVIEREEPILRGAIERHRAGTWRRAT